MEWEDLDTAQRAAIAREALANLAFKYVFNLEISDSTALAINGVTSEIRDQHRYATIALGTFATTLQELADASHG